MNTIEVMLSKRDHKIKRLKEIAEEISKSTEETLEQNPEWFEELIEIYNEILKRRLKPKPNYDQTTYWRD